MMTELYYETLSRLGFSDREEYRELWTGLESRGGDVDKLIKDFCIYAQIWTDGFNAGKEVMRFI